MTLMRASQLTQHVVPSFPDPGLPPALAPPPPSAIPPTTTMEQEAEGVCVAQGENLHDLQNYLVTFNKEIEPGEDVLAAMGVVGDLYSEQGPATLQEEGDQPGGEPAEFSSGFYSEQNILEGSLAEVGTHRLVEDANLSSLKQEEEALDVETVQAHINGFGESALTQNVLDGQERAFLPQSIIGLGEGLDTGSNKMFRIISRPEDGGQFITLIDGQDVQGLNLNQKLVGIYPEDVVTNIDIASVKDSSDPVNVAVIDSYGGITPVAPFRGVESQNHHMVSLQDVEHSAAPQIMTLAAAAPSLAPVTTATDGGQPTVDGLGLVMVMTPDGSKHVVQMIDSQTLVDVKSEAISYVEDAGEQHGDVKKVFSVLPPKKPLLKPLQPPGPLLSCDFCEYTTTKRYLLNRHLKSHSNDRPFTCRECKRGFKTAVSLQNHENTHTGTRPHKCRTCDAAFTTSGELMRHVRYKHTFEKPHHCPSCDYASVELSKLKRHMRSHTGERPYKCPHCPYASPDTYKLKRHLRTHTGEKPYECDICHARFTQSNSLKAHKMTHTNDRPVFACHLCNVTCGRRTDLKIHYNKLHNVSQPIECKKCGKVFSDRYSYKQHLRVHDSDKCRESATYYKCGECGVSAMSESSLQHHINSCHRKNSAVLDKTDKNVLGPPKMKKTVVNVEGKEVKSVVDDASIRRSILLDLQLGKLDRVPQVVIVHPDGSNEEISSKTLEVNLESQTDKTEMKEKDSSSHALSNDNAASNEQPVEKESVEHNNDSANVRLDTSEAGTQAEIDSDEESDGNSCLDGNQIVKSFPSLKNSCTVDSKVVELGLANHENCINIENSQMLIEKVASQPQCNEDVEISVDNVDSPLYDNQEVDVETVSPVNGDLGEEIDCLVVDSASKSGDSISIAVDNFVSGHVHKHSENDISFVNSKDCMSNIVENNGASNTQINSPPHSYEDNLVKASIKNCRIELNLEEKSESFDKHLRLDSDSSKLTCDSIENHQSQSSKDLIENFEPEIETLCNFNVKKTLDKSCKSKKLKSRATKREADETDPSLVRRGKRIRKALVKISM